jgi:hypothetical protein
MIPDILDVFPYMWGMIPVDTLTTVMFLDILDVFPFVWGDDPS